MGTPIDKLTIEGFKSIRKLENFELRGLNVLIGANGAGKSNFVDFFRFLQELIDRNLQLTTAKRGGAHRILFLGPKVTQRIAANIVFENMGESGLQRRVSHEFVLEPTIDNRLIFATEMMSCSDFNSDWGDQLGAGHQESNLAMGLSARKLHIPRWRVYHFHDTSGTAPMKLPCTVRDYEYLRPDAANLAPFLLRIQQENAATYGFIRDTVRLTAPFFNDFILRPRKSGPDVDVLMEWSQVGGVDYPFHPSQLSDGTLRFICLATALLQPNPPSTVIIDEPELGLHPHALSILTSLIKQATAKGTQVIVSTQSTALVDDFEPEDIVVVDRDTGQSRFRRLTAGELSAWVEIDYSLGELWQKNVLGGGPVHE